MKFYDIHVGRSNSFSVFVVISKDDADRQYVIDEALERGLLEDDDEQYINNFTEIDQKEYKKAMSNIKLTNAQKKDYIQTGGIGCPRCGDTQNLDAGSFHTDCGVAWQDITCNTCGLEFQDDYNLTGVEEQ